MMSFLWRQWLDKIRVYNFASCDGVQRGIYSIFSCGSDSVMQRLWYSAALCVENSVDDGCNAALMM